MAQRSYAPRHAFVPEPAPTAPSTGRRAATVVAASVGVAAAATALAGPASAQDSQSTVWDRVANCESSQNWHIDTGNGYYGGLQFDSGTWAAYNGHKYAQQADGASRMEQIQVARRVLAKQGPDAWPVCGPRAGLTKDSGNATSARLPDDPDSTATTESYSAKHRTAHRAHVISRRAKQTAHHSEARHHSAAQHGSYVVRSGDTLSAIAARKHVAGGWHALWHANRAHVPNPNVLHIGQHLRMP